MKLPAQPKIRRRCLDDRFDASDPREVERAIESLLHGPPSDFREASRWFGRFHELSLAISETHTRLELAVQLDNGDSAAERRLQEFDSAVVTRTLEARKGLIGTYLDSPWTSSMHADDRGRLRLDFSKRVRCVGASVVPLQIEENRLMRAHRALVNQGAVLLRGRKVSLPYVVGRLQDADDEMRHAAFKAYWGFLEEREADFQGLFDELLSNRREQARLLGASGYAEVAFAELGRIDYDAADCRRFHAAIRAEVVPLLGQLARARFPGTGKVPAADAQAWPEILPRVPPAGGSLELLLDGLGVIAGRLHPAFASLLTRMRREGCIDIEPRPRKNAGAFCVTLPESETPFLFANFSGSFRDALTLAHEFGHVLHAEAALGIPNILLRQPGLEFCEVASMGFEAMAASHFDAWWSDPADIGRARAAQAHHALGFWPFMSMIDLWQHRVYAENLDANARNQLWKELNAEFRPEIDTSAAPAFETLGWMSRPHVFSSPFYYVDYGIAQLGALQLKTAYAADPTATVRAYIHALGLGGQRSLPELFSATGLRFDLSAEAIAPLARGLAAEVLSIRR